MAPIPPGSHYIDTADVPWQETRFPGIRMKILWQDPHSEAFTALFQMSPGAKLPRHRHTGIEQTFVLEGSLADESGTCTAGNFVWRDVGSVHAASSPEGCLSIGIFQKSNEFLDDVSQIVEA
ncbi:MAG: cupin domain-containing protein [Planctomycetota bacterium]|nr:cupin domain-containing protein [Planctomycetota bacterium]MDA1211913.1 cupin domain-containing protein [Planctomycetota bacterium]